MKKYELASSCCIIVCLLHAVAADGGEGNGISGSGPLGALEVEVGPRGRHGRAEAALHVVREHRRVTAASEGASFADVSRSCVFDPG